MAVIFPSVGLQILSSLIYFLGLSILAHCLSRRVEGLTSWASFKAMSWPRSCVDLIFLDSWLFLFSSGLLIFGVGLETVIGACTAGILVCVIFYASSKVLIYCFLAEKVHLVWSPTTGKSRWRSSVYLACITSIVAYSVVVVLMITGRVHYWRDDGVCVIGLKSYSSIPLLSFDLYINLFLNGLFLWPLFRSKIVNPRIRSVAIRTLIASSAALTTSLVNIGVLTAAHGQQLGWVCLGSCGTDVILNALAIFWVTNGRRGSNNRTEDPEIPGETIPHGPESQRIPMSSIRSDIVLLSSPKTATRPQLQPMPNLGPICENDMENNSLTSTLTHDSEKIANNLEKQRFPMRIFGSRNAPRPLEVLVTTQHEVEEDRVETIQPKP
ncbi:hypothetical protein E1B28_006497 [Marasmius oreades]|uniref:Transmembrane protein n=1 Tax=Marasmius oreades TaxID=181124 RepID=A0A9P7S6I3_9AGAR|nr:uncharacterized protein E1B28_006497 [Marasmius oreades]KAG7095797.1 hypothetical protein E1B28_006497 [Marasmius oreades]